MRQKEYVQSIFIALTTIAIYILTTSTGTRQMVSTFYLTYILLAVVGIVYWPFIRANLQSEVLRRTYLMVVFVSLLLWIGVTGWFVSPFFYFLFIIAIVLGFVYSTFTTFLFILVLMGVFLPNVGSIDFSLDFVTLFTLAGTVPLTYYLQNEYLHLKQTENKILILKDEKKVIHNQVDHVLANKVSKFAVDLRQPMNDARQVALHAIKDSKSADMREILHKIAILTRESLDQIERFEEFATGTDLIHTRKK